MPSLAILSDCDRVKRLFDLGAAIKEEQTQAHFARYLAVTLCGLLEQTSKTLVIEYSRRKANPRTAAYCAAAVANFRNPNSEKLLSLVGRFDADWREKLETFLSGKTGAAVDSIKTLWDAVAHGINHNASFGAVTKYRDEILNRRILRGDV
jgi:hypothetical protein